MVPTVSRELDPGVVAGSLGLAVLAGLALPQAYGLAVPLLVVVAMALLAERHGRRVVAVRAAGVHRSLSTQPPARRVALALTLALPTVVIGAVAARGVSSLVAAFPAAIWGLMAAAFAGLVLTLLPLGRGRWLVAVGFAAAVPAAGIAGQRWEDTGQHARGWAYTGAVLGIHPFQSTAVVVDGYGPHDLPVNDYVEPDGVRGYGPDELAAALQHAVRAIGPLHYSDGPARARMAFENFRVLATTTEATREELDREPVSPFASRLVFFSGTTGQRSRVQFVCPGQRTDPRGVIADTVTNPMCPSKYITEASAGLSVTGRWAGYTEARGQERFGLARTFLGGVRTDDLRGGRVIEREIRWGAWLLLAGLAVVAIPRRQRGSAQEGLSAIAGALGVLGVLVAVWVVAFETGVPSLSWWTVPPTWSAFDITAWTPALAIGGVAVATLGPGQAARVGPGAIRIGAVPLALAVLASASALGAAQWLSVDLYTTGNVLAYERLVAGLADALWESGFGFSDWTVQEMEAAVASVTAVLLSGAGLAMLCAWGTAIDPPRGAPGRHWVRGSAVLIVVAIAAMVTVSRKTAGASALLPGAMAILLVHGSCMGMMALGRRRPISTAVHLGLIALGLWAVSASTGSLPSHVFVTVSTGLGMLACVSGLVFLTRTAPGTAEPEALGGPSGDAPRDPPEAA